MIKKLLLLAFITGFTLLPLSATAAAGNPVDVFNDVCSQNGTGGAAACKDKNLNGKNPLYGQDGVITKVANILSIMVGLAAVISIIWAGMRLITSGNNPEEVNKAREYIQYAAIGLVLAAIAQALIRLVLYKIGV